MFNLFPNMKQNTTARAQRLRSTIIEALENYAINTKHRRDACYHEGEQRYIDRLSRIERAIEAVQDNSFHKQYIVVRGNPLTGILLIGPFVYKEDAEAFAVDIPGECWISEVHTPIYTGTVK